MRSRFIDLLKVLSQKSTTDEAWLTEDETYCADFALL